MTDLFCYEGSPTNDFSILPHSREARVSESDLADYAMQLVENAKSLGIPLTGDGGLLADLNRKVLQAALDAEMKEHLGYAHNDRAAKLTTNMRNGSTPKTVHTELGSITLDIPRDRDGTFEPVIIEKHQRRIDGFDEQVLTLYSKGMTTEDIMDYLAQMYNTKVSKETISRITDAVVDELKAWQQRPLESVYPVIFIDAIVLKIRDGQVANRPVYVALSIDREGNRDVLGIWVGPSGGEGAKQWLGMLNDLKNRGVKDVCIVCCDGLKGLPESIRATWPEAIIQTCVVHLIRNSLRYVKRSEMKEVANDLRLIYTAPTEDAALEWLRYVKDKWEALYPAMTAAWERSWVEFSPFLAFPPDVRKIIYTTNSIESLNSRFRKAVRKRGHFPTEQSALKVLYLSAIRKEKNRDNPTSKVLNWGPIYNTLSLMFGSRLDDR